MTRECRRSHFNRCRVSTCFLPLSHFLSFFLSFFPTSCHLASLPPIKIYFVSFGSRSTCFIPVSLKLYIYISFDANIWKYSRNLFIYLFIFPNVETRKEIYDKKRIFGICFFIREYSRESSYLLIYENLFDSFRDRIEYKRRITITQ